MSNLTPEGLPLTEEEQKLVARLLSDPFFFPLQFKTWLEWFIEGVQGNIAGGVKTGGATAITGIPIGGILFIAGSTLPSNCLWTDGAAYSRTGYNDLFKEIGATYGAGDGSTTFNVPDMQGRGIVGRGPHSDVNALGKNDGVIAALRRGFKHRHTPHTHPSDGQKYTGVFAAAPGGTNVVSQMGTEVIGAVDGGSGNPNDPLDGGAFIVLNGIIRYV